LAIACWDVEFVRRIFKSKGATLIPMDVAARYIWKESKWAREHAEDPQWYMTLQRDFRDVLRLGKVSAFGRPTLPTGEIPAGFASAMQPIDASHWQHGQPQLLDALIGNKTSNASRNLGGSNAGFYDIHLDRSGVRANWLPMGIVERRRHKPLILD
jgi:hypothetical protein